MPRRAEGSWDDRSQRYYARLGEMNPETGRRRSVMLTHEDGRPIAFGDKGAVAFAIRRLLAAREAEERRSAGPLVIDVVNQYIAWHTANGSKESTIQGHRDHLGMFCRFEHQGTAYGIRPAASMKLEDLSRMRKAMIAAGNATGYIKNRYASVLACWNWAARPVEDREPERLITTNPFAGVKRPSRGEIREKAVEWELARAILRFIRGMSRPRGKLKRRDWPAPNFPSRDRQRWRLNILAAHMTAVTGCRPGEAIGLTWDEIDWKFRVAIMSRDKMYSRTGNKRVLYFTRRFMSALKAIKDSRFAHPVYVFMPAGSRKEKPPTARELAAWFRRLRQDAVEAGVSAVVDGERLTVPADMTLYWLRHSYATDNTHTDREIENLAQLMGNSPGEIRKTYRHTTYRKLSEYAERLARERRRKNRATGPDESASS